MAEESPQDKIQRIQTEYRRRLAHTWAIPEGSRILEIGCGQGDMTAVLAEAVGSEGSVLAVDRAGRNYGAPQTLGQATDLLKATKIGSRIEFLFEFDILGRHDKMERDAFDLAVLAHSSWYFSSKEELFQTLQTIRLWAKKLCFAEWDMQPVLPEQIPHLVAVLIQAQVESFKPESQANIRTPLPRRVFESLLEAAGWKAIKKETLDVGPLQDPDWEIQECLRSSLSDAHNLNLPSKILNTLEAQIDFLKEMALPQGNRALNSYSIIAERSEPPPFLNLTG